MQSTQPIRQHNLIGDVNADLGSGRIVEDFYVFCGDEAKIRDYFLGKTICSDHIKVVLVVKGEAEIKHNLIDYNLRKNSLFIITPKAVHQFQKPLAGSHIIGIGFSCDFIAQVNISGKYIDESDFLSSGSMPKYFLSNKEAKIIKNLLLRLREKDLAGERQPFKNEIIYHAFNLFVYEMAAILKKHRPNEGLKLTRKENIAGSFIKILLSHFKEERRVEFYADALFITPKHLSKTLKGITNKTCSELIDEMVITEAKILLENVGQSVAGVAKQLHFSDQFFFSKFFKRHTGINPSQYKHNYKVNYK